MIVRSIGTANGNTKTVQGICFVLSRTCDGIPPFFEAYWPFTAEHVGILPRLKVGGADYWGSCWSWRKADQAFCDRLNAVMQRDG